MELGSPAKGVLPPPRQKTTTRNEVAMEKATLEVATTNLEDPARDSCTSSEDAEDSEIPLKSVDNVS